jgi:hypothetical protein
LGTVSALLLVIACGGLGMLAADGTHAIGLDAGTLLASGGNGAALGVVAVWFAIRRSESRRHPGDDYDVIGVTVFAAVLLALPLVEDFANAWAGLGGALVGLAAGFAAYAAGPRSE